MIRTLFAPLFAALLVPTAALAAPAWPDLSRAPKAQGGGENDAALIVAIEKYVAVAPVPGAVQNGVDWYTYLTDARWVPPENIQFLRNNEASLEKMRKYAAEVAGRVKPGGTLWLVFVGHGAPAKDGRDGVLVGFDAQQDADSLYARSLAQRELLALVEKGKQARTVAVIDACFSGRSGNGSELIRGLQPLISVSSTAASLGRATVMTAGSADQFAGPLPGADRPAFSYLVLGALRGWGDVNGDGTVTTIEAVRYARKALQTVLRDRSQTPELAGDGADAPLAPRATESGPDLASIARGGAPAPVEVAPAAPSPDPHPQPPPSAATTAENAQREAEAKARNALALGIRGAEGSPPASSGAPVAAPAEGPSPSPTPAGARTLEIASESDDLHYAAKFVSADGTFACPQEVSLFAPCRLRVPAGSGTLSVSGAADFSQPLEVASGTTSARIVHRSPLLLIAGGALAAAGGVGCAVAGQYHPFDSNTSDSSVGTPLLLSSIAVGVVGLSLGIYDLASDHDYATVEAR